MKHKLFLCLAITGICTSLTAQDKLYIHPIQGNVVEHDMQSRTKLVFENGTDVVLYSPNEVARYSLDNLRSVATVASEGPYQLIDGTDFVNNSQVLKSQGITYTRTFYAADTWHAFYVPINIAVTDELLANFTIAELYAYIPDTDTNGDGTIDGNDTPSLYVLPLESGDQICANNPYFVRPNVTLAEPYVFTSSDNILFPAESRSVDCSTTRTRYVFTGIYETTPLQPNMWYVARDGYLKHTNNASAELGAYRWYMQKIAKDAYNSGDEPSGRAEQIKLIGEDLDATALENLMQGNVDNMIYTILGVPVGREIGNLPTGIYIRNGQKLFINQ